MKIKFSVDFDLIIKELKDFEKVKKILKYPYYFYKTFPQLENKSEKEIVKYFKENKIEIIKKLKERKIYIESVWKPVNNSFFKKITKLTDFDWKFKNYDCFLSCAWAGRYFLSEYFLSQNNVEIFAFLEDEDTINILAEELFHLHFWYYLEKKMNTNTDFIRKKEAYEFSRRDKKLWELSEIVAGFVLPEIGFYKNLKWFVHWWESDPKMGKLYKELKPLWKERKGFEEFLRKSIEISGG